MGRAIRVVVLAELMACSPPVRGTFAVFDSGAPTKVVGQSATADGPYKLYLLRGDEPLYLTADQFPVHLITATFDPALDPGAVADLSCELLHYKSAARGVILESGAAVSWTPVEKIPDTSFDGLLIGAQRLTECSGGCWEFSEVPLRPAISKDASFASALGMTALIGYHDGSMFRVDTDGNAETVCGGSGGPGVPELTAGVWVGGDTVWLGFEDGVLSRLDLREQDPARPCLSHTVTQAVDGYTIRALAAAPMEEPHELFAVTSSGASTVRFERWDGQRFTERLHYENADDNVAVLRLGPRYAMATLDSQDVAFIQGENTFLQPVGHDFGATLNVAPQSLAPDGRGGAWVGAAHRGLLHFTPPRRWDTVQQAEGVYSVNSVARFDDRTFYVSSGGVLSQIPDRGGTCPEGVNAFPWGQGVDHAEATLVLPFGPDQLLIPRALELDAFSELVGVRTALMRRKGAPP